MEGMLPETESIRSRMYETALALRDLLLDHRGDDVLVLDLRGMSSHSGDGAWTDFFIIATSTSDAHMDGLELHIKEFCHERGIDILRRSLRPAGEDEWRIIDLGSIVIHLMNSRTRAFYNLERLYSITGVNKDK